MEWKPIETAPKDGEFLATDGVLLGVGRHYRHVEPDTVGDYDRWKKERAAFDAAYPPCPDFYRDRNDMWATDKAMAWEREKQAAAKAAGIKMHSVPNPKAGHVKEWYSASAFHAFDGETETLDDDGPVGFRPTKWQPLPQPPTNPQTALRPESDSSA